MCLDGVFTSMRPVMEPDCAGLKATQLKKLRKYEIPRRLYDRVSSGSMQKDCDRR